MAHESTEPINPAPFIDQPTKSEPLKGVTPMTRFYVERREDHLARELIKRQGVTLTITGPRYVGKTSMLMRLEAQAIELGKRVVALNFLQEFDQPALASADVFFHQFCKLVTDELGLEDQIEKQWYPSLGNSQRCTRYMSRYLLQQVDNPLLLALDNVDAVFNADFCDDFFGMLRGWHDSRGRLSQPVWQQLDLVLVTSTEPYRLIKDPHQSLFNVSIVIDLLDFTQDEVTQLNQLYGSPLKTDRQVQELMKLVAGHPDLVRRALEWVASGRCQPAELFSRAIDDQGPFGRHLKRHLEWLSKLPLEKTALLQVIENNTLSNEPMFFRLQGAGLIRRGRNNIVPRCLLYAEYFRERLQHD
jgi:hypothetical protein